ncbi:hypothetical protein F4819DRAFT_485162 [Hypoxylon fuscum]|nr:hypothetical protein F4819DRAFT_485162 [Hypoxylon fuscum]
MGQTTSSNQPEPDLENQLDPVFKIDTAEKFQSEFSYEFRHECLFERYELREAFDFSSDTEYDVSEGQLSWDKHALADFLGAVVPVKLKADLDVASPLLLKAMIRLGSFPFHNRQTPSTLGADEAFVAILLLIRLHERYSMFSFDLEDHDDDDDKVQQIYDRYFHRLLFQVMSNKPGLDPQHELQGRDKLSARDPAADEDLILTRNFLEERNYTRDMRNPKQIVRLPPVIEVSELPSSRSRDLAGTVPREEFRALPNVLCGIGNHTSVDIDQLIETQGTDWHGF